MSANLKIALLLITLLMLAAYKILIPWTPFWLDICFIVIGVTIILSIGTKKKDKEG